MAVALNSVVRRTIFLGIRERITVNELFELPDKLAECAAEFSDLIVLGEHDFVNLTQFVLQMHH